MSTFIYGTLINLQGNLHRFVFTILHFSKRIFCLYDDLISSYVVSGLLDSLQEFFFSLQFLLVGQVLHVPPHEVVKGCEIWLPPYQACVPKQAQSVRD
jgi:hypothetical protein